MQHNHTYVRSIIISFEFHICNHEIDIGFFLFSRLHEPAYHASTDVQVEASLKNIIIYIVYARSIRDGTPDPSLQSIRCLRFKWSRSFEWLHWPAMCCPILHAEMAQWHTSRTLWTSVKIDWQGAGFAPRLFTSSILFDLMQHNHYDLLRTTLANVGVSDQNCDGIEQNRSITISIVFKFIEINWGRITPSIASVACIHRYDFQLHWRANSRVAPSYLLF